MKVTINGRIKNERVTELEQRESHYFEVIKSAAWLVVGVFAFMFVSGVFYVYTLLPSGIGETVVHAYQSLR